MRASAAPGQVVSVWEVFSGKASLTLHLGKTDLCTLPGVDVVDGPLHWDLTNEGVMKRVFKWIRDKNIQYVHLGTPCTSFSMALRGAARTRSKSNVLGDLNFARDKTANTLVRNSVRIIRYMERLGRFWSLENPLSSLIWLFPGLCELRHSRFFVKLDQCVYGAGIPGEGLCKKATAILTNLGSLWGLRSKCRCEEEHVQLKGSFKHHGRWIARTKFAGRYPYRLGHHWAQLVQMGLLPDLSPKRVLALANWVRLFLLLSGHRHGPRENARYGYRGMRVGEASNPGPRSRAHGAHILDVGDVSAPTARVYAKAFTELNEYVSAIESHGMAGVLSREGGPGVSRWVSRFLKDKFDTKRRSKVGQASHVVSAVRRWLLLTAAGGVEIPELTATLRPLRRMLRVWQMLTPSSFRRPVWREVALTMAVAALLDQKPRVCLLILLQFHGLLRPGEARHVRWVDLGFLASHEHEQYPDTFGVVGIVRPKTRRMSSHSVHQYVTIESRILASLLQRLMSRVSPSDLERPIWPGTNHELRLWWLRTVTRLGLLELNITWAGLRAGGATDFWLRTKNLPALRRRGRWSNEQTLERYIQESVFVQCSLRLPTRVSETLRRVSALSGVLLANPPEDYLTLEVVVHRRADDSSSDDESN